MTTRRQFVQALGSAAALGGLYPLSASAQPVDQVKVLFGFPAGSSGDTVARRVAEKWAGSAFSKNPGVVENKPGAGGRIALETLKGADHVRVVFLRGAGDNFCAGGDPDWTLRQEDRDEHHHVEIAGGCGDHSGCS